MTAKDSLQDELAGFQTKMQALKEALQAVVVGQEAVVEALLTCLVANGHCLLQGVPGLGKTLLMRSLAKALQLDFKRIQFTPDLMPADIIGSEMVEQDPRSQSLHLSFVPGPVFCQLLLADEINRTPPKTQAALLEAMQERSVTVAGKRYPLGPPFMVLATQNPIEQSGTYDLPEAQLDRFMMCVRISYPERQQEIAMLSHRTEADLDGLSVKLGADELLRMLALSQEVYVDASIQAYIIDLARQTRPETTSLDDVAERLRSGVSPRAAVALQRACQARAVMQGRLSVLPDDVQQLLQSVWGHRLLLNFQASLDQVAVDELLQGILASVPSP